MKQEHIDIVKSLAPVLRSHGPAIAQKMYELIFAESPATREFFTLEFFHCPRRGSIAPALERNSACPISAQADRLAKAILECCLNIENIDVLTRSVRPIAAVHVSRGVEPAHYPVVGATLIEAVKKVLGADVPRRTLDAIADAYGTLSDVFIAEEDAIRDSLLSRPAGWVGHREFVVVKVEGERGGRLVTISPLDGGKAMGYYPGQTLCLRWRNDQHGVLVRNVMLIASSLRPTVPRDSYTFRLTRCLQNVGGVISSQELLMRDVRLDLKLGVSPPCGGYTNLSDGDVLDSSPNSPWASSGASLDEETPLKAQVIRKLCSLELSGSLPPVSSDPGLLLKRASYSLKGAPARVQSDANTAAASCSADARRARSLNVEAYDTLKEEFDDALRSTSSAASCTPGPSAFRDLDDWSLPASPAQTSSPLKRESLRGTLLCSSDEQEQLKLGHSFAARASSLSFLSRSLSQRSGANTTSSTEWDESSDVEGPDDDDEDDAGSAALPRRMRSYLSMSVGERTPIPQMRASPGIFDGELGPQRVCRLGGLRGGVSSAQALSLKFGGGRPGQTVCRARVGRRLGFC